MSAIPQQPSSSVTSLDRRIRMLRTAMGPLIAAALEDPDVVEVMLNPDGTLWIDRLSTGRAATGESLSAADGERIIRLVAAHVGTEVHRGGELCACFGVSRSVVEAAIADGAASLAAVGTTTQAGINCGSCRPEIRALLRAARVAKVA